MQKTKEQKYEEIEQYFYKSEIPEFERKIEYIKKLIKDCRGKIGKLLPFILEKEVTLAKSKNEEIKKKIKKIQRKIINAKKGRIRRKERKTREEIKKEQEKYYTEKEIDDIIKYGKIYWRR